MTTPKLPKGWDDAEEFHGLDVRDKSTLIGVPFLITAVWFHTNRNADPEIHYVNIDAEDATGAPFTFNDSSSTGIRKQIMDRLKETGRDHVIDAEGEILPLRMVIRNGLRVSEFDVMVVNPESGRRERRRANVYHLTLSGQRGPTEGTGVRPGAAEKPAEKPKTTRAPRARKMAPKPAEKAAEAPAA